MIEQNVGQQDFNSTTLIDEPSNRVDSSCDYYQTLANGETYNVYSPGYPGLYAAGTDCRWTAVAPRGYHINLDCSDVNIPVVTKSGTK